MTARPCIILDLNNNVGGGSYPPTLIMNNVVYGTGGRCIETNTNSQQNIFIINNTCYKNALDLTLTNAVGNIVVTSTSTYVANNVSYAWSGRSGNLLNYQLGAGGSAQWFKDSYTGGAGNSFSNAGLVNFDPLFGLVGFFGNYSLPSVSGCPISQ